MKNEKKSKINEVVDEVNNLILEQMAKGRVPWKCPWSPGDDCARNVISKKGYRGANYWILAMVSQAAGYSRPWFLTFKQAKELKGNVRKGEKSVPVLFWSVVLSTKDDSGNKLPEGQKGKAIPCLKYYRVFNVDQVEGIDWREVLPPIKEFDAWDPDQKAESIIDSMPQKPIVSHSGSRACYMPATDKVVIPERSRFDQSEAYYSTMFHELAHATGHQSRLNRPGIVKVAAFGTETYSREELCAELASSYLLRHCGQFSGEELKQSASYIAGWSEYIKSDPRAFVVAAGHAHKAAEFILGESEVES